MLYSKNVLSELKVVFDDTDRKNTNIYLIPETLVSQLKIGGDSLVIFSFNLWHKICEKLRHYYKLNLLYEGRMIITNFWQFSSPVSINFGKAGYDYF